MFCPRDEFMISYYSQNKHHLFSEQHKQTNPGKGEALYFV